MPLYRLSALFLTAALAAPLAAQQPLSPDGQSVTGEITTESEILSESVQYTDLYTLRGTAGERVVIDLMSEDFDAYLEIGRMEDGTFISLRSDDDSGGNLNSRLTFTFPETGDYLVRARPLGPGSLGTYLIEANLMGPPAPPPPPVAISIGETVDGEFTLDSPTYESDYGAERHYALYRLEGEAGQTVSILLHSDDFDSYVETGGMTPVGFGVTASNDDSEYYSDEMEPSLDSRLTVTFVESGTLLIRATTLQGGSVGTYSLTVE